SCARLSECYQLRGYWSRLVQGDWLPRLCNASYQRPCWHHQYLSCDIARKALRKSSCSYGRCGTSLPVSICGLQLGGGTSRGVRDCILSHRIGLPDAVV